VDGTWKMVSVKCKRDDYNQKGLTYEQSELPWPSRMTTNLRISL
jgi:hypothetical protein